MRAPFALDPRTDFHVTDGRRYVARAAAGCLGLISMEPLLPYAPGTVSLYTREFYQLCSRALSDDGLMVQWVPTHSMPEHYFRTLLATFASKGGYVDVFRVRESTNAIVGQQLSKDISFACDVDCINKAVGLATSKAGLQSEDRSPQAAKC